MSLRSKIHHRNDGYVENLPKIIKDFLRLRMVFKVPKRISFVDIIKPALEREFDV